MKSRETSQQGKAEKQRSREKQKNWKASKPGTRNPGKKKQHLPEQKIFLKKNVQFRSRFGDPATRSPRNESIILGCYVFFRPPDWETLLVKFIGSLHFKLTPQSWVKRLLDWQPAGQRKMWFQ